MRRSLVYYLQLFLLSMGVMLICILPSNAQSLESCANKFPNSKCVDSVTEILPQLKQADVVYLGETHNSSPDHQKQLQIIQGLYQNNPKMAIALEMFQRPYQEIINQYIDGKLSETELLEQSEYESRWGFDWQLYAPIMRFARAKKLHVLALNTPSEITRKVARQGIESLISAEKQQIPPISEIRTDNAEYRRMVLKSFQQHQAAGHGNSGSAERFWQAQVLWDETMAEAIAIFRQANPDYQIVVLAGQAHIVYGYGIPNRVERRIQEQKFIQRSVLLNVPEVTPVEKDQPIADFLFK